MEKLHIFLEIKYTILKVNFAYIDKNKLFFKFIRNKKGYTHGMDCKVKISGFKL